MFNELDGLLLSFSGSKTFKNQNIKASLGISDSDYIVLQCIWISIELRLGIMQMNNVDQ